MVSKRKLYEIGEPLGESVTKKVAGITTYGGGGGGGSSSSVQSIPEELKPLAAQYTSKALDLSNTPYQAYTGQRYADLNPVQYSGLGMTTERALGGSDTMNNAENSLNQLISGGNTNPYLDAMVNQAQEATTRNYANSVAPQITAMGVGSGSFGNSGVAEQARNSAQDLQTSLGNIATNMYGGAYDQDAARRMQAIGMAPTFGNQAYTDASQLMNAGQIMQDQAQQNKDFQYQQFQDQQNDPYKKLAAMSGVFGSGLGTQTTTTQNSGGK
jgi:hypothetical protein